MKFHDVVPNISTLNDKKRIASQYVIDHRNLSEEDLDAALLKSAPQYYNEDNVRRSLNELMFDQDRSIRILHQLMLKTIMLNQDDFQMPQKELDQTVIDLEQEIVNQSNKELQFKNEEKNRNLSLFQFVLEVSWDRNDDISPDEKNLIERLRSRLRITDHEYQLIEAKLGRFPKDQNVIHTRDEIKTCRHHLHSQGLLLCLRDSSKVDYDVIPDELAQTLRKIWGIELKEHGYRALLEDKRVRYKQYLKDILEKADVDYDKYATVDDLQELVINHVKPSNLLGGFSPRDGLDSSVLAEWCRELSLSSSGQKNELINRIIGYHDELKRMAYTGNHEADEQELLLSHFKELASRDLNELRKQKIIAKDIDCERRFEEATYYVFEKYLGHKPLQLTGTEHPDGMLAYKDKLIMWDNKSKESPVNLKDHIRQFDRYISGSQKPVAGFVVVADSFTPESSKEAMKYKIDNDIPIALLSATDLREVATDYQRKNDEDPFPLANFLQAGPIDVAGFLY